MAFLSDALLVPIPWLLTYTLHGTVLLSAAWLVGKLLGKRKLFLQETLWKTALIGGLITASLQTGLNLEPLGGSWLVANENSLTEPVRPTRMESFDTALVAPPLNRDMETRSKVSSSKTRPAVAPLEKPIATVQESQWSLPKLSLQPQMAVALWLLIATALCGFLAFTYALLHFRLRDKKEVKEGGLWLLLANILSGSGMVQKIMLSCSQRIESPIAMGIWKSQIVIPQKAIDALSPEQQETMLAHEVAHIRNSDPFWLLLGRFLESLFFFQPLNRMARKKLQELAEYRCDEWAAAHTGKPLALARCLTEVAEWRLDSHSSFPVPGMADGSELGARVRRLVALDKNLLPNRKTSKGFMVLICATLAMVAWAVPGFQGQGDPSPNRVPQSQFPVVPFSVEQSNAGHPDNAPEPAAAPNHSIATALVPDHATEAVPPPKKISDNHPVQEPAPLAAISGKEDVATPVILETPRTMALAVPKAAAPTPDHAPMPLPMPTSAVESAPLAQEEMDDENYDERIDSVEEEWSNIIHNFQEEFDRAVDRFEDRVEAVSDAAEDKAERSVWRKMREEAIEDKFENFEDEAESILDGIDDQLDSIEDRFDSDLSLMGNFNEVRVNQLNQNLETTLKQWRKDYMAALTKLEKGLSKLKRKYT